MRIVMVAARYYPYMGGIETVVHETARRIAAWGHEIVVLTTDPSGTLVDEEICDGIQIKRVRAWPKNRDYYFAPGIYRYLSQNSFDILHLQGYNTFVAPITMLAAIKYDIPFVVNFHAGGHPSRFRSAIRGVQQKAIASLVARANQLVAISEFEIALFSQRMRLDPSRFTLIYNGSSLPLPSDPPPATEPHLILSVGRLERHKGHQRAITAMPFVRSRIPDARLQIVGSGPYEANLRCLADSLGITEYVSFVSIPPAERRRVADLLYSAGLIVLLSEFEGNPMAVMEALAAARPVLVADTTGMSELARKGWCRSVPIDANPRVIADAMITEIEVDHQQKATFTLDSWDDCTRRLLDVYKKCLLHHEVS